MTNSLMSASEGYAILEEKVQSFLANPRDTAIKSPCGLGKTSCFVSGFQSVYSQYDGTCEIYVPTLQLAEELANSIRYSDRWRGFRLPNNKYYSGVPVVVIRGRGQTNRYGNPMCRRANMAAALSRKGISVYQNLCASVDRKCPHFGSCLYNQQFNEDAFVRIYPHAYLSLPRSILDREMPEIAVIDESFYSSMLRHRKLNISDLAELNRYDGLGETIEVALVRQRPLLEHLSFEYGGDLLSILDLAIDAKSDDRPVMSPNMGQREQSRIIRSLPEMNRLLPMLRAIKTELKTGRAISHAVNCRDGLIHVHYREDLHRFRDVSRQVPVLAIDADLNPGIHDVFFPGADFHEINVERNCEVTQVYSTRNSLYSLTGGRDSPIHIGHTQVIIDREAAAGPVFVAGPQSVVGNPRANVEPLFNVPEDSALAHFGSIRGVDAYKEFSTVILISRNQPSLYGLEAEARALWYDSPEPLAFCDDWVEMPLGYRMRDQSLSGVNVVCHPDSRVQALLEQIRESESTQAIDRLRPIHCEGTKRVIILSNIPLNITVDRLVSWPELVSGGQPLAQAWERLDGVMPLTAAFLQASFPGLFPTIAGARYALRKNSIQKCEIPNIYSIRDYALLAAYTYRISGQRGRHSTCLSEYDENSTRDVLEDLLGEDVTIINKVAERDRHDPRHQALLQMEQTEDDTRPELDPTPVHPVAGPT